MKRIRDEEAWRKRADKLWDEALSKADGLLLQRSFESDAEDLRLSIAASRIEAELDKHQLEPAPSHLSKKLLAIAEPPRRKYKASALWVGGLSAAAILLLAVGIGGKQVREGDATDEVLIAQTQLELDITLHYLRKATAMSRTQLRESLATNVQAVLQEADDDARNTRL